MNRQCALAIALVLVLQFCATIGFQSLRVAEANFMYPPLEKIYIKSDGSIAPQTASMSRLEDVYYLTGNITNCVIEVQRDNIVINGAGYTLHKTIPAMGRQDGVALNGRRNVTIINLGVNGFGYGVFISNSFGCNVSENKFTNNQFGVVLADQAKDNFISSNRFISGGGVSIYYSVNNVLRNNTMVGNGLNFWVECEKAESPSDFINDVDPSNTVNGKPICYWINQHNRIVPSKTGFVALINCSGITVENLNLANNGQGVLLISTKDSQIANNNLTNNNKGIALYNSQNNSFTWNIIANNTHGIVAFSQTNTFRNNRLDNNTYDVNFEDRFIDEFDYSNIVDGTPICYWIWQHDRVVPVNVGYVVLLSCSNITVQNLNITNRRQAMLLVGLNNSVIIRNSITNNGVGIILKGSSNSNILRNLIANNSDGLHIEASLFNEISGNKISFNANSSIHMDDSSDNIITGNYVTHSKNGFTLNRGGNNTVAGNSILYTKERAFHIGESGYNRITGNNIAWSKGRALTVWGSLGYNKIHHNDFVNNAGDPYQAYPGSNTRNTWDDGQEGNYWSDYQSKYPEAKEIAASGIGNIPVVMNEINVDRYPLTKPISIKYQLTILYPADLAYETSSVPLVFFATAPVTWTGYSLDGKANVTVTENTLLVNLPLGVHSITAYAGEYEGGVCASETIHFETTKQPTNPSPTTQPTTPLSQSPQPTTNTPSPPLTPFSSAQPTSSTSPQDTENNPPLPISTVLLALTGATVSTISIAIIFKLKRRS